MAKFFISALLCLVAVAGVVECGSFGFMGTQVGPCGANTAGQYVQEHCMAGLPCQECKCTVKQTHMSPLYFIDHSDCRWATACTGPNCGGSGSCTGPNCGGSGSGQGSGQGSGSEENSGEGSSQGQGSGQFGGLFGGK